VLKILIIEDEAHIALQIKTFLIRRGLNVIGYAANRSEAYALFEQYQPEIIICDIRLQNDENGIKIIEEFRKLGIFEVLYLTSYSDYATLEKAFSTNPFNYITKPFKEIDIFTAVMLCISKLKEQQKNQHCRYNPDIRMLFCGDAEIFLSQQEAALFHLCYLNRGHYVPMALIEQTLWSDREVNDSTRRGLFHRLGKKVGKELFEYHSLHGCRVNL